MTAGLDVGAAGTPSPLLFAAEALDRFATITELRVVRAALELARPDAKCSVSMIARALGSDPTVVKRGLRAALASGTLRAVALPGKARLRTYAPGERLEGLVYWEHGVPERDLAPRVEAAVARPENTARGQSVPKQPGAAEGLSGTPCPQTLPFGDTSSPNPPAVSRATAPDSTSRIHEDVDDDDEAILARYAELTGNRPSPRDRDALREALAGGLPPGAILDGLPVIAGRARGPVSSLRFFLTAVARELERPAPPPERRRRPSEPPPPPPAREAAPCEPPPSTPPERLAEAIAREAFRRRPGVEIAEVLEMLAAWAATDGVAASPPVLREAAERASAAVRGPGVTGSPAPAPLWAAEDPAHDEGPPGMPPEATAGDWPSAADHHDSFGVSPDHASVRGRGERTRVDEGLEACRTCGARFHDAGRGCPRCLARRILRGAA